MRSERRLLPGSLQSRFMATFGLMLVTVMILVTAAVSERLGHLLMEASRAKAVAIAQSIAATTRNALLHYDYVTIAQATEQAVADVHIVYVAIWDKEGRLAGDATDDGLTRQTRDAVAARPSVRGTATVRTEIATEKGAKRVLDVALPVMLENSDVQWGTVRLGLDLEPMYAAIWRVRLILLAIGLASVLLALAAGRIISRRIGRSVDELVQGTIEISRGNLDHRIEIESDDEIATLARHFNHMTEQVRKQQQEIAEAKGELEAMNSTLEDKVARRTQEFLASEEKYRTLVDHSPDPIVINQDGVIRFVNPAFTAMFGYELDDSFATELRVEDLFHSTDRDRALRFLGQILRGEEAEAQEFLGLAHDGQRKVFEMRGLPISYMGEPAVELILLDTTEKQELQDSLVRHEKLRALGELASGVAHDFNNILGIILGRAQLLQRKVEDVEVRRGLRTIERAAFDGGETVRRIQDFARSRTERDFEDIRLNPLLEEVIEITRTRWRDEAEVRNVKIDVELDLGPPQTLRGNGSELREAYTNLIFNAVDAMPTGGSIRIASALDGEDTVVTVRDTGKGMDESTRLRIFDPFFSTKGDEGMGLGMSVVYGIIERHAGTISVESTPGEGTCFTIRIPACEPEDAATVDKADAAEASLRARVLAVDDEAEILELISDILQEGGCRVQTAGGGEEALAKFAPGEVDLVLCDLGMRDMSGWEVVNAIRSRDSQVGVVLVTGWGATLSEEKVDEYGIDAVLNKPFEMKKMIETVADVLEQRGSRAATP